MTDDLAVTHISDAKALITAGWDDVPHLTEEKKAQLLASTPKYMRDARTKGVPALGAGAIYQISIEEISVPPFAIPAHWPRAYAMDVGWRRTAAIWGAQDPLDGTIYLYSEYYKGEELPEVHAAGIKARGAWIKGAVDPASRGRNQSDGKQLFKQYKNAGLLLSIADNSVHAGINLVETMLVTGQLKVFSTLNNYFGEYRTYRREIKTNEYGVKRPIIVKSNDHLMDAKRYLIMEFNNIARTKPADFILPSSIGPADTTTGL